MKKQKSLFPLFMVMILLLSACSNASSGSHSGGAVIEDEPYEAVDYNLYPSPEGGYVGDVMPFVTDDGTLEIYYLCETDTNGQGYHPIWKYSTKDLCSYKDHGMVLNYGTGADPDPALGTGSVMQDQEGLYHLFYTGHNDNGNGGKGKECVMHASSTDRENWVKDEEPVFFAPEGYSKDDFRDPEVFWVERDQCYWLLIAGREETLGGVVVKYTSKDLKNWEFVGPFFAPMAQYMLECPDLFNIGNKWYLTYSWDCVTYYAMSDSMDGPFVPARDNVLDGQGLTEGNGFVFYAAKTAQFNGKTYLCGWHGRAGLVGDSGIYQWAGNVMNHELVQLADGRLGVKAPEVFDTYFTADKPFKIAAKEGNAKVDGNSVALSAKEDSGSEKYQNEDEIPEDVSLFGGWIHVGKNYITDLWKVDFNELLADYKGHMLLLHGDKDKTVPLSWSENAKEIIPDCEFYVIKDGGHEFFGQPFEDAMSHILPYLDKQLNS